MSDVSFEDIHVEELAQSTPTAGPITPVAISAGSASIENVRLVNCSLPKAPPGSKDGYAGVCTHPSIYRMSESLAAEDVMSCAGLRSDRG